MHKCICWYNNNLIIFTTSHTAAVAAADYDDTSSKTKEMRSATNRVYCATSVMKCSSQFSVPCRHCYYTELLISP